MVAIYWHMNWYGCPVSALAPWIWNTRAYADISKALGNWECTSSTVLLPVDLVYAFSAFTPHDWIQADHKRDLIYVGIANVIRIFHMAKIPYINELFSPTCPFILYIYRFWCLCVYAIARNNQYT